jgi:hypothetical protein
VFSDCFWDRWGRRHESGSRLMPQLDKNGYTW